MLKSIENKMAAELKKNGVAAEITFFRVDMFSALVDDAGQFDSAKAILATVPGVTFDSEDRDDECGHVAYFRF